LDRELIINILLNNTGDSSAYNAEWSDTPPLDFLVTSGTTSWTGNLAPDAKKYLTYKVLSDDPIICRSISTATYQDRFGNEYLSFSDDSTAKFSPYLTLEKKLRGESSIDRNLGEVSFFLSPDKSEARGNRTMRLGEKVNASLTVKNIGTAIARDVFINDSSGRLIKGIDEFSTSLKPGEEISFSYEAEIHSKDLNLTVSMSYLDINSDAFNASSVIEAETPNYCSRELETVTYSIGGGLDILYPDVTVTPSGDLESLSEFEVDYNLTIKNNGTDGVHDVYVYIDTEDLKRAPLRYGGAILKGQPLYYLKELDIGAEQNFTLILRAPTVENKTSFIIKARVNYTDFFGNVHSTNETTTLEVIRPKPSFAIVQVIEKGLNLTIGAPRESEIGEYGSGVISMESVGFAPLEKIELSLSLPPGFELFSNDTGWEGRFEAQLKRENQTWFGYVDEIVWKGNLSTHAKKKIDFLLRGTKAGLYNIPYNITFDDNILSGLIDVKVRGPRLEIEKRLNRKSVPQGKEIEVTVEVINVGEASAKDVRLVDKTPVNFQIKGETTKVLEELDPEEATGFKYTMKNDVAGSYTSGVATVRWKDSLGNEYLVESPDLSIDVLAPIELPPELIKPPETAPSPTPLKTPTGPILGRGDIVITSVFTVVIMTILIKLLAISKSSSKK